MWIGRVLSTWYPHAHIKNWWRGSEGQVRVSGCCGFTSFSCFHDDDNDTMTSFAWLITIWLKFMLQFFFFYLILLKLEQRRTRLGCFFFLFCSVWLCYFLFWICMFIDFCFVFFFHLKRLLIIFFFSICKEFSVKVNNFGMGRNTKRNNASNYSNETWVLQAREERFKGVKIVFFIQQH